MAKIRVNKIKVHLCLVLNKPHKQSVYLETKLPLRQAHYSVLNKTHKTINLDYRIKIAFLDNKIIKYKIINNNKIIKFLVKILKTNNKLNNLEFNKIHNNKDCLAVLIKLSLTKILYLVIKILKA